VIAFILTYLQSTVAFAIPVLAVVNVIDHCLVTALQLKSYKF